MAVTTSLKVGEVKIPEDADFRLFKSMCEENDGWKLEVNKAQTMVWTKANELSDFKMVKVRCVFDDIDIATMYDVLHDPQYRKTWDRTMLEGAEICAINPNNDIGYYAIRSPPPLKNRDFVTQRSWLDCGYEKIIFNHSVNHSARPPRKGVIRGTSYLTGYYLVKLEDRKTQLTYVSQSDPKGNLPAWAVNKLTKMFAPKVIGRIYKAAKGYEAWKSKNRPEFKPWANPEQMMSSLPKFNPADVASDEKLAASNESLEEGELEEADFKDEDY
ncbi:START domain-containing protein 10 [Aplysia californica]|uniref:START domain-containing protein 10 n=1 Tax=Aplysia californica TaxID=6500 RepID=A0ABM0JMZ7_APLCA|nr:START domain-containing protein 10 [Aplysia californica]